MRAGKLGKILHLVNEAEWRFPDRPTIQLSLGYCFAAEEICYVTQLDAFAHYRPTPLPGTIFGGRFPIHAWVRPLMWAFEWHDTGKDLVLKRGDPLCYCQFEADGPDRPIQLIAVERTPELERWVASMQGVASLINQTFSLFRATEQASGKASGAEVVTRFGGAGSALASGRPVTFNAISPPGGGTWRPMTCGCGRRRNDCLAPRRPRRAVLFGRNPDLAAAGARSVSKPCAVGSGAHARQRCALCWIGARVPKLVAAPQSKADTARQAIARSEAASGRAASAQQPGPHPLSAGRGL